MRMTEKEPNILYVRMLGGFSVRWNGKLIAGGSKASDSQLTCLLQIPIALRRKSRILSAYPPLMLPAFPQKPVLISREF